MRSDAFSQRSAKPKLVMPGLKREARLRAYAPGIHVFKAARKKDVDGRDIGERKRRRPSDGYTRP
jgi:hypothetical protein